MQPPYNCAYCFQDKASVAGSTEAHRVIVHDIAERMIRAVCLVHQSPNRTRRARRVGRGSGVYGTHAGSRALGKSIRRNGR
jgi:hypothetical protein